MHIHGMNLPWIDGQYDHDIGRNPFHTTSGSSYSSSRTAGLLADIKFMGANVMRVWLFENQEGLVLDVDGSVIRLDPLFLANLDDLIRTAERNGLYLYFTFVNYLDIDPGTVMDSTRRSAYLTNALTPIVGRYLGKSIIFAYEVGNELQYIVGTHSITWSNLRRYVADTTSAIKAVEPKRLVGSSTTWDIAQAGNTLGLGLDFYDVHVYGDTWNPSGTGSPGYASELGLDKPVLIGEFGQGTTTKQDDDLQVNVVNQYQTNGRELGYAGVVAWAYGGASDTGPHVFTHPDGTWRPAAFTFQSFTVDTESMQ